MYSSFGEIVKAYREEHNLSMAEFANRAGISKAYIGVLERGENYETGKAVVPSIKMLSKLASAMGMTLSELLEAAPNSSIATTEREQPTATVDDGLDEKKRQLIDLILQLPPDAVERLLKVAELILPPQTQETD